MNITAGYVINNKDHLIPQIIEGLKKSFSKDDEVIFLFDNCSDNSYEEVKKHDPKGHFHYLHSLNEDLFETKANNKVLRYFMENSKNDTIILFQDDIVCNDPMIKEKIERIQKIFGDKLGIMGGRTGFELHSTDYPEKPILKVSNWEHKQDQYGISIKKYDGFARRTFINRGPIVLTRRLIERVGYFDEDYYPQQFDDMEYCARCKFQYGLENVVFQCDVVCKLEWGTTRQKTSNLKSMFHGKHYKKNWNKFIEKWRGYLK